LSARYSYQCKIVGANFSNANFRSIGLLISANILNMHKTIHGTESPCKTDFHCTQWAAVTYCVPRSSYFAVHLFSYTITVAF